MLNVLRDKSQRILSLNSSELYALNSLFFLNLFFITALLSVFKQFLDHYFGIFPLTISTFPISFFFCVVIDIFISRKLRTVFLSVCILYLFLVFFSTYFLDFYSAYDSLGYHKQPMFWLYEGNNPRFSISRIGQ